MKKKARPEVTLKNLLIVGKLVAVLPFFLFLPANPTLKPELPTAVRASEWADFKVSKYPRQIYQQEAPEISAAAGAVIDLESGAILYTKDADRKLYPASITKLMTALVARDFYTIDQVLTVKRLAPTNGESDMGLAVGDRVRTQELLYGLLVPSGNDAAYTLADNYPGGIENFIYSMNKKAESLHMNSTRFNNPSGLDNSNNYSTARDIAYLTVSALKDGLISKIVATSGITLTDADGKKKYQLANVNKFLNYLPGADGVKTGYTDLAGENLVASVSRNGHRIISVVLNSKDRFADSVNLIEWAYRNFIWDDYNNN